MFRKREGQLSGETQRSLHGTFCSRLLQHQTHFTSPIRGVTSFEAH